MKWASSCHQSLPPLTRPLCEGTRKQWTPEGLPYAAYGWTLDSHDDLPQKSHQLLLDQPGPLLLLSKPKGRGCGRHRVLPNLPVVTQLPKPEKWISEEPVAWLMINEWHWMTPGWACVEEKGFSAMESLDVILRNQYEFNSTLVSCCHSWTMEFHKFLCRKVLILFSGSQTWQFNLCNCSYSEGLFLKQNCRKRLICIKNNETHRPQAYHPSLPWFYLH